MNNWKTLPKETPINTETVWCRINYWFGQPFKAVWNVATTLFTSENNGIEYPAWSVMRWKSLSEWITKNLGNTSIGTATYNGIERRAIQVTMTEIGKIESLTIYHESGTGQMIMAIYSDDGANKPQTRLAITNTENVAASAGWQTLQLQNSYDAANGEKLWIAYIFQNTINLKYTTGGTVRAVSPATWADGMPVSFGSSTTAQYALTQYLTYQTLG